MVWEETKQGDSIEGKAVWKLVILYYGCKTRGIQHEIKGQEKVRNEPDQNKV